MKVLLKGKELVVDSVGIFLNEFRLKTYDSFGNKLIHSNINGYWCKSTYDSSGNEIGFTNNSGDIWGKVKW